MNTNKENRENRNELLRVLKEREKELAPLVTNLESELASVGLTILHLEWELGVGRG